MRVGMSHIRCEDVGETIAYLNQLARFSTPATWLSTTSIGPTRAASCSGGTQRATDRCVVGGCTGTDNSPHAANDQLIWWLNTDSRTSQGQVETMTDVSWNS